jgi:hypothetical protein
VLVHRVVGAWCGLVGPEEQVVPQRVGDAALGDPVRLSVYWGRRSGGEVVNERAGFVLGCGRLVSGRRSRRGGTGVVHRSEAVVS